MASQNCSPRRKRSGTTDSSQPHSTVARSTPIRETFISSDVPSPNISSIRSCNTSLSNATNSRVAIKSSVPKTHNLQEELQELQPLELSEQFSLLQAGKRTLETDSSDESPTNVKKSRFVKNKGQNWKFVKPQNNESLYYKIISRKYETKLLASKWCKDYKTNNKKAIIELQQLFVDLTGVQNIKMYELLIEKGNELKSVLRIVEKAILDSDLEKYYLCNSTNSWNEQCLEEISNFLHHLWIVSSVRNILFDYNMIGETLKLLSLMASSAVIVIHHTGVFLAAKILTITSEVHKYIIRTVVNSEKLEEYLSALLKTERCLYCVIHQNCCMMSQFSQPRMKLQVIKEMKYWFKYIPHLAFKEKQFSSLVELVEDLKNSQVRQHAVTLCKYLIGTLKFAEFLTYVMDTLVITVEGRIWDFDYNVAISAVEFFTSICNNYPNNLTKTLSAAIVKITFHKHYPLARAAGEFTVNYFLKTYGRTSPGSLILHLMNLIMIPKFSGLVPLLVESVIDFAEEFYDYDLFYKLLMNDHNGSEENRILCCLFSQIVIQTINGQSTVFREKSKRGNANQLANKKIVMFFIPRLYDLMKKFSNDAKCIKCLCEMLLTFNFNDIPVSQCIEDLDRLMRLFISLFLKNIDEEVLDLISKIYSIWSVDSSLVNVRTISAFMVVLEQTVKVYKSNLEEYYEDESEFRKSKLEVQLLRMEVLFRHNNLTEYIDWTTLFVEWNFQSDFFTIQAIQRNIRCCYWFLIWQTRNLKNMADAISNQVLQQCVDQLESKCNNFVSQCLLLMEENQEGTNILDTAYEVVCDLHLQLLEELHKKFDSYNHQFKQLHLKVSTIQFQNVLVDYVLKRAFKDKEKDTIIVGRSYLIRLMDAFIEDVMPFCSHFEKIYKYYAEYDCYGDIFDLTLEQFQEIGGALTICAIVVRTMEYCYFEYLSLSESFDSRSPQAEKIKELGERFLVFIKRKAAKDSVSAIIKAVISRSASRPGNQNLLNLFSSFVSALNNTERKEVYTLIMQKAPKEDKDARKPFLNFAKLLKTKKEKKIFTSTEESTYTESEDVNLIEEVISD